MHSPGRVDTLKQAPTVRALAGRRLSEEIYINSPAPLSFPLLHTNQQACGGAIGGLTNPPSSASSEALTQQLWSFLVLLRPIFAGFSLFGVRFTFFIELIDVVDDLRKKSCFAVK